MGILVDKRTKAIPCVQDVLTKNGDMILSRFGLHDPGEEEHGLITLNIREDKCVVEKLEHELGAIDGVLVRMIAME
jgi:hypothetical protein